MKIHFVVLFVRNLCALSSCKCIDSMLDMTIFVSKTLLTLGHSATSFAACAN